MIQTMIMSAISTLVGAFTVMYIYNFATTTSPARVFHDNITHDCQTTRIYENTLFCKKENAIVELKINKTTMIHFSKSSIDETHYSR